MMMMKMKTELEDADGDDVNLVEFPTAVMTNPTLERRIENALIFCSSKQPKFVICYYLANLRQDLDVQ